MIVRIKKILYRILPTSLYLACMQHGFFILFDLGILKSDERFKFHYATKKLIKEGDVVLDIAFTAGAALFAIGHILAITLYRRHIRPNLSDTDRMIGALLIGVPVGIAWALTQKAEVALYTLLLGSMASAAWVSRFPTKLTALGAVLFIISDLLIFARMGPLSGSLIASLLVWTLYFGGQFLIALGGTRYLALHQNA